MAVLRAARPRALRVSQAGALRAALWASSTPLDLLPKGWKYLYSMGQNCHFQTNVQWIKSLAQPRFFFSEDDFYTLRPLVINGCPLGGPFRGPLGILGRGPKRAHAQAILRATLRPPGQAAQRVKSVFFLRPSQLKTNVQ